MTGKLRVCVTAAAIGAALLGGPAATSAASRSAAGAAGWRQVIVTGQPGALADVEHQVIAAGGRIERALPLVAGVAARLPADRIGEVRALPGVRSVSDDAVGHLMSNDPVLGYDLTGDEGSTLEIAQVTHANDAWKKGATGAGVDVALIDSGVVPVPGLNSGNVINGPDLSFESTQPALRYLDTYGHGTHMASIIAGRDVRQSGKDYAAATNHTFSGIAPDARIISLKVATSDGAADVSQVIAAIDWVVQHAHDPGFNIRVLNLSYGTDSTQPATIDPLAYAVENAWRAGITVVVASGNDGTQRTTLADPADDPLVIAVGADDPEGDQGIGNDQVPVWAQRGTDQRHVDLIAPAVHVLGLRAPGSAVDQANASARVGGRFFRGSGTSQAAAVVSGLAALYLSQFPAASPDQVKAALIGSAKLPSAERPIHAGYGVPDVQRALTGKQPTATQPPSYASGWGSLEAARGSMHVNDGLADLVGEFDIFGKPWDAAGWAAASTARTAWQGGVWNGSTWTGTDWSGSSWTQSWASNAWAVNDWTSHAWSSHVWGSHAWRADGWSGGSWTGSAWSSNAWAGHAWSTFGWS